MNEALERIAVGLETKKPNKKQQEYLKKLWDNPSFLLNQPNQTIKEEMDYVLELDDYFKRDRVKVITLEREYDNQQTPMDIV